MRHAHGSGSAYKRLLLMSKRMRIADYRESRAEEERLSVRERDIARSLTFLEKSLPGVSTSDCPICLGPMG